MTPFWSAWIMFLVVFNMGITFFLFLWGQRVEIPVQPDGTSGHVWAHGVLREGVRKLPRWWVYLSAAMFATGAVYLVLYPGFGSFGGVLGWSAHGELARDRLANDSRIQELTDYFATVPVQALAENPAATQMGGRLFRDNCSACHGATAHGNPLLGAPDLTDPDWLYGGDPETVATSILEGRHGTMPPFGDTFGEAGVANLAHYVRSLSGGTHDAAKAAAGQPQFAVCAACHGAEGKGNPAVGAPNLTDHRWLYGGDLATLQQTIRAGRSGVMPAWKTRLDEREVHLVTAWLRAQSHGG